MISDYQPGRLIFFDGDIGKYFYGTILSVEADRDLNWLYMTVLNRNGEVCNLNLDKDAMKQWTTEHDYITIQQN